MEMNQIELRRPLKNLLQLHHVVGHGFAAFRIEPQGPRAGGDQLRLRRGVAARKKRNFMPLRHQRFRKIRYDPLGSAVDLRRYAFKQWRNLRDSHPLPPSPAYGARSGSFNSANSAPNW